MAPSPPVIDSCCDSVGGEEPNIQANPNRREAENGAESRTIRCATVFAPTGALTLTGNLNFALEWRRRVFENGRSDFDRYSLSGGSLATVVPEPSIMVPPGLHIGCTGDIQEQEAEKLLLSTGTHV